MHVLPPFVPCARFDDCRNQREGIRVRFPVYLFERGLELQFLTSGVIVTGENDYFAFFSTNYVSSRVRSFPFGINPQIRRAA